MAGPRSRWLLLTLPVVIAAGVVAFAITRRGHDGSKSVATPPVVHSIRRVGSRALPDSVPFAITNEPSGFHITYDVTQVGSNVGREDDTVARPFTGETVTRRSDGLITDRLRWAFGRVLKGAKAHNSLVLAVGPSMPGADVRVGPAIDQAVKDGLLRVREQREVLGRRCQVLRAATSVQAGTLKAFPTSPSGEHADVCIDRHGLVLEEWWVVHGKPFEHRVATNVVERAPARFGAGWSDVAQTATPAHGGGAILRLVAGSAPPGEWFEGATVPSGFDAVGRFTVVPPQTNEFADPSRHYDIRASTADVWRRGIDILLVEQGGTLGGAPAYELDPAHRTVDIPGLGTAELIVGLQGNEVRVLRPHGHFIRAIGTLPLDALVDVLRSLHLTTGNEIVVDKGGLQAPG